MKTHVKTIKDVIMHPTHFFRKISSHGIKEPLKFFIFISLFTQLLLVYHFLKSGFEIPLSQMGLGVSFTPAFTIKTFIAVYALALIWTIFFGFLWPFTAHVFIKLFNKKAQYKETFKCIIYGGTPAYVTVPFYIILMGTGFSLLWTRSPAVIVVFFLSLIVQLIAHIYTIYLKLMSISRLQKISMFKGFLCVYILPVTMLIVLEIILIVVIFLLHLL